MIFSTYLNILLIIVAFDSFTFTREGMKQVNVQINPARRDILRNLYDNYKKEHRYHGQA